MRIPLPKRAFLELKVGRIPTVSTSGICNRTNDGYYTVFCEYDNVEKTVPLEDVIFYQKNFDMGPMLFLTSSKEYSKDGVDVGNYHLIGFTKWTFPEVKGLIELSRSDDNYKRGWSRPARCWVLRVAPKLDMSGNMLKPKPYGPVVLPAETARAASMGTVRFFERCYHIRIAQHFMVLDKDDKWPQMVDYPTR